MRNQFSERHTIRAAVGAGARLVSTVGSRDDFSRAQDPKSTQLNSGPNIRGRNAGDDQFPRNDGTIRQGDIETNSTSRCNDTPYLAGAQRRVRRERDDAAAVIGALLGVVWATRARGARHGEEVLRRRRERPCFARGAEEVARLPKERRVECDPLEPPLGLRGPARGRGGGGGGP